MTLRQITELCQALTIMCRVNVELRQPAVTGLQAIVKKLSAKKPTGSKVPSKPAKKEPEVEVIPERTYSMDALTKRMTY